MEQMIPVIISKSINYLNNWKHKICLRLILIQVVKRLLINPYQ
jgi:hypothetical protein